VDDEAALDKEVGSRVTLDWHAAAPLLATDATLAALSRLHQGQLLWAATRLSSALAGMLGACAGSHVAAAAAPAEGGAGGGGGDSGAAASEEPECLEADGCAMLTEAEVAAYEAAAAARKRRAGAAAAALSVSHSGSEESSHGSGSSASGDDAADPSYDGSGDDD
jgi:hypothetical protein